MFVEYRVKRKSKLGINITPLIDVIFLLLIFFMVSSSFIEKPAIELTLPQAKTAQLKRAEETIISVDKDGTIYVNSEKILPHQLRQKLGEIQLTKHEEQIILQADEDVAYKTIIFVMDTARDIGFKNIVALTTKTEPADE